MKKRVEIIENKICFIICSNNSLFLEECLFYISRLEIPLGYEIETISITDAKSIASGYNEGMKATNAKYKIYLHQDVFIVYKKFLQSVLDIFNSDSSIGMIGMVGSPKMPVNGVMWHGCREGALYGVTLNKEEYVSYTYHLTDGLYEVDAIDGLMMITCVDIPWRQDIFDGWDFYDVSQSLEFQKRGYKVVVPEQLCAWCKHDDGILNLANYNKYRKICISEYSEYFNPERFYVKKIRREIRELGGKTNICIAIIVRNQFKQLMTTLDTIKYFTDIDNSSVVIVDNGSQDGVYHWLKRQEEYNYIICGEMIEGYSSILNEVVEQFIEEENLLIITPDLILMPNGVENLNNMLQKDTGIGAVCGKSFFSSSKDFKEAVNVSAIQNEIRDTRKVLGLPFQGVMISNQMLKEVNFDNQLVLPQNVMNDFSFRGILKNYDYYEISNECFYQVSDSSSYYLKKRKESDERSIIKEKWEMNYFNITPNNVLISCIERQPDEEFSVLEIGCDCGANLLEVQNNYPKVKTYGIEINSSSASIASHITRVQVANIEEQTLDFEGEKFDYIIFGDVLEHLRNPKRTLEYCKSLLKKNGRIIASIPNIMHYSVLRQMINGNFTYTDTGLLDRTHIHFFTYKEIIRMFMDLEYQMEEISIIQVGKPTEDDMKFVDILKKLSYDTEEFMFWAFQYIVCANIN